MGVGPPQLVGLVVHGEGVWPPKLLRNQTYGVFTVHAHLTNVRVARPVCPEQGSKKINSYIIVYFHEINTFNIYITDFFVNCKKKYVIRLHFLLLLVI